MASLSNPLHDSIQRAFGAYYIPLYCETYIPSMKYRRDQLISNYFPQILVQNNHLISKILTPSEKDQQFKKRNFHHLSLHQFELSPWLLKIYGLNTITQNSIKNFYTALS